MKILIEFDYVDKFGTPQLALFVDDSLLYSGDVRPNITANINLLDGPHYLKIVHSNKKVSDFDETHDRHIIIKKIFFDDVDLDQTKYCPLTHRGKFYPVYESSYKETCLSQGMQLPEFICPNHYLGHNGTWVLEFSSPVYSWIIDEQKPSGINLEDTIFSTGSDSLAQIKSFFNV